MEPALKYIQQELYSYNSNGTLRWEYKQSNPAGLTGTNTDHAVRVDYPSYNYQKQLLEQVVDVNNDNRVDFKTTYAYDGWGNLKKVAYGLGTAVKDIADFDYDVANALMINKRYHAANGVVDNIAYTYDTRLRQTGMTSWGFDYTLYYDLSNPALGVLPSVNYNGNINAVAAYYHLPQPALINTDLPIPVTTLTGPPPALPSRLVSTFTYDGLNRLTAANYNLDPGVQGADIYGVRSSRSSFSYDAAGNFTGQSYLFTEVNLKLSGPTTTSENLYQNFSYEAGSNRLSQLAEGRSISSTPQVRTFSHDANGNMTAHQKRGISAIAYSENLPYRLSNASGTSHFTYNASGKRTYKEVRRTNNQLLSKEYYLYDMAGNTLAVYDSLAGSWQWYINAGQPLATLSPATGTQPKPGTAPAATLTSNSFSNGVPVYVAQGVPAVLPVYLLSDHLGSTRLSYTAAIDATDKITYNVMTMHDFLPYGKVWREYVNGKNDRFQFTGYELDGESGLNNALARLQDPELGRFLGVDPLMMKFPSMSPFNYCFNNPVGHTDPSGMAPPDIYSLDTQGNIKFEKTAPGDDILMTKKSFDKGEQADAKNSITVPNNVLNAMSQTARGTRLDFSGDEAAAKSTFEFAVKNTNVEFSKFAIGLGQTGIQQNYVATSHAAKEETYGSQFIVRSAEAGNPILSYDHNHTLITRDPNTGAIKYPSPYPSISDKDLRDQIHQTSPNATFSIFTRNGAYKHY
ncbi:MAG: RHS repeat-associated core domain-containing protein [Bacteroidota bacterium]